jgi:four helix bundle protein
MASYIENGMDDGSSKPIESYRDLIAWEKARQLCLSVYSATKAYPADERFGMTSETRRTARSVVYNIAEGHERRTTTEYLRFLDIARGSRGELETQLILATDLGYLSEEQSQHLLCLSDEVGRLVYALAESLRRRRRRSSR